MEFLTTQVARQLATIATVMIVLDAAWLTYLTPTFRTMIAAIQGVPLQVRWFPAALVYVLMIAGLWWFVVRPAAGDWRAAATNGAALGAVVYGVYDLTNYSTIAKYSPTVAVMDILWGSFLFAVTGAAASLY